MALMCLAIGCPLVGVTVSLASASVCYGMLAFAQGPSSGRPILIVFSGAYNGFPVSQQFWGVLAYCCSFFLELVIMRPGDYGRSWWAKPSPPAGLIKEYGYQSAFSWTYLYGNLGINRYFAHLFPRGVYER